MTDHQDKPAPAGPRGPKMSPREKAAANPKSAKLAIAAYCYHECIGEQETNSHTSKLTVKNCADGACPLWPHRGWQTITGGNVGRRT